MDRREIDDLQQIAQDMRRSIARVTARWQKAKGAQRRELGRWIADAEVQLVAVEQQIENAE